MAGVQVQRRNACRTQVRNVRRRQRPQPGPVTRLRKVACTRETALRCAASAHHTEPDSVQVHRRRARPCRRRADVGQSERTQSCIHRRSGSRSVRAWVGDVEGRRIPFRRNDLQANSERGQQRARLHAEARNDCVGVQATVTVASARVRLDARHSGLLQPARASRSCSTRIPRPAARTARQAARVYACASPDSSSAQ